ncbi:NAD(P)-binding domain-containing protein [Microbacterium sp. ZXX196]|uniref:NAD(P)-binding domain-containing protein n=1 Tax=Microbacterium sp. ZXX196 TaxID=2609291 RepID=UPI00132581E9|nr:NAD(P)-binding protein [Microbacterium sp. ZXX196]
MTTFADVVVIGAGQAGLSAAHHLARAGFRAARDGGSGPTFVVLDAADGPGGAWRERWESLTVATLNGIFALPGADAPALDPSEPSRDAVPRYFAEFEAAEGVPILRPARVTRVEEDSAGGLAVHTAGGLWRARAIVNATGTWDNPLRPSLPGSDRFAGRQLHTRDYRSLEEFRGARVAIVGGGISAIQHLEEVSRVADTLWYTRREPVFADGPFRPETTGRATIARVTADAEAGRPVTSIVGYTGLTWFPAARAARDRGILVRREMFVEMTERGVVEADGSATRVDHVLWATGFRPALGHLDPLHLTGPAGGIPVQGTRVATDPRIHLVGFGPSQSTVGANRAGRLAARDLRALLGA